MGSYLVFVAVGFILVLFCLETQPASFTQSSSSSSSSAAAAAVGPETTESNESKLQLKVIKEPSLKHFDAHCCHMGTAIKHPVPDRVKPSFVIFDIRAL